MTRITFFKKNDLINGFEVSGHTGKNKAGKDLLCCQISTIAQLAVVGIKEIANAEEFCEISDGFLKIIVNNKNANNTQLQFLLKTCLVSFQSVIQGEEKFAKLEVKNV